MKNWSGVLRATWGGLKQLRRLSGPDGLLPRLERLEERARREWGPDASAAPGDDFYFAFESRFRGPRELIRARLEHYLPFVRRAGLGAGTAPLLDLGCGRGEWLELLRDNAVPARGIDISARMVAAARERGLQAEIADILPYLRALPPAGLGGISAFHVIEHLPVPALLEMLAASRRALRPGGLLILETPNPENPVVGSCDFFVDPTHRRPVPPALLSFLVNWAGFVAADIVRVPATAPSFDATGAACPEQADGVWRAVSERMCVPYDYAVVARAGGN